MESSKKVASEHLNLADLASLAQNIKTWAHALGFADARIGKAEIKPRAQQHLQDWLAAGQHGSMDYMVRHAELRQNPALLHPGTVRVISVRMNYLPATHFSPPKTIPINADWRETAWQRLHTPGAATVSLYAQGRDYHKVLRQRLQSLAEQITEQVGEFGYRVFTDSAPVMEVELAQQARLGWRGKHTLLLTRQAGSMFFLGEIFTDLPLPLDRNETADAESDAPGHCGTCTQCIDICPTGAIVAPYQLDARRCISYLTIEHAGPIPLEWRRALGNRIYGCDDCQLICPWNKFAQTASVPDFAVRNGLDSASLLSLFAWTEADFNERLQGSPIRRIGYSRWLRNIAVALGNADTTDASLQSATLHTEILQALHAQAQHPDALVREHVQWAIEEQSKQNRHASLSMVNNTGHSDN